MKRDGQQITFIHLLHGKKIYYKRVFSKGNLLEHFEDDINDFDDLYDAKELDLSPEEKKEQIEKLRERFQALKTAREGNTEFNQYITNDQDTLNEMIERRIGSPVIRFSHDPNKIVFTPYKSIWDNLPNWMTNIASQSQTIPDLCSYQINNLQVKLTMQEDHINFTEASDQPAIVTEKDNGKSDVTIKHHCNEINEEQYFNTKKYHIKYRPENVRTKTFR